MRLVASELIALALIAGPLSSCGSTSGCEAELGLSADQCAVVKAMRLPATLPPSPGNKYADDTGAASLGFQLFFSSQVGQGISCATCHTPEAAFTDTRQVALGKGVGVRNTLTVFDPARLQRSFFWDGRADSLWSQALFPIEDPVEMGSSRLSLAHALANNPVLSSAYQGVFGALPADLAALPAAGKPGDLAWDSLAPAQQDEVNRVAANFGKALEAYERKNTSGTGPLDAYLDGTPGALSGIAKTGLAVFVRAGCATCHAGSSFSDERFHDVGFPSLPGAAPDQGRAQGAAILAASVFNLAGPYADSPQPVDVTEQAIGTFRTPPLRNVNKTQPYGHNGVFASLAELIAFHASAQTAQEQEALLAFLLALDGSYPPPPWSNWPTPG